jgi:uncharacterized membrane protein
VPESSTSSGRGSRRNTVIASGLLCGVLALLVMFTDRATFFSPLAVVIVAAIGAVAALLQLRFRNRGEEHKVRPPLWLSVAGAVFALGAVLSGSLHLSAQVAQVLALAAVGSFAISSVIILQAFRKRRSGR